MGLRECLGLAFTVNRNQEVRGVAPNRQVIVTERFPHRFDNGRQGLKEGGIFDDLEKFRPQRALPAEDSEAPVSKTSLVDAAIRKCPAGSGC